MAPDTRFSRLNKCNRAIRYDGASQALCAKGRAAPELVYSKERLTQRRGDT